MNTQDQLPVACTLEGGTYRERIASIEALARDGLRDVKRNDLRLELTFSPDVVSRVREMVSQERECCGFLQFELTETAEDVRVTITAPERARDVADAVFEQFVPPPSASTLSADV
jgi:hypothetical protein